jgi:hypothetical protein
MTPTLTAEQTAEAYRIVVEGGYVQIWHGNTQIGLLIDREGVEERARELVERRRAELREVAEKTGWTPTLPPTG